MRTVRLRGSAIEQERRQLGLAEPPYDEANHVVSDRILLDTCRKSALSSLFVLAQITSDFADSGELT